MGQGGAEGGNRAAGPAPAQHVGRVEALRQRVSVAPPTRRKAIWFSGLAVAGGALAVLLFAIALALRGPCPPHYVRILDFDGLALRFACLCTVLSAAIFVSEFRTLRRHSDRPIGARTWGSVVVSLVLCAVVLLLAVVAVLSMVTEASGSPIDIGCL